MPDRADPPSVLPKSHWAHLIPHAGTMCLLDDVIAWDTMRLHARTRSHHAADNPLRSDGRLRALHLCEYGAQAMAVHGGLVAQAEGVAARPGFLVSLRQVELALERIDQLPAALDVFAERLLGGGGSWQYSFIVESAGARIASGRAAVVERAPAE